LVDGGEAASKRREQRSDLVKVKPDTSVKLLLSILVLLLHIGLGFFNPGMNAVYRCIL
jgi:hypothetical protein